MKRLQIQKLKISPKLRLIMFSSAIFTVAAVALIIYANFGTSQKVQAGTGMHGVGSVTLGNTILNEFTTLTADVSAGATQISVASNSINANGRFSTSLETGSLIMIIQMQGATMNTATTTTSVWGAVSSLNNAGKYEFAEVSGTPSGKINLTTALKNSYTTAGKTQIVRVPRYTTLTVNAGASITTDDWNGSTGGIVAVEVNGATTINGSINVVGKGFRGGAVEQNSSCCPGNHSKYASASSSDGSEKGEGIGGSQTTYDGLGGRYGRGAPANGGAGGNSHNGSGGGGSNGGTVASWDGLGNPDNSVANWVTAWNLESASFSTHTSSGGGRGGYTYSSANANPLTKAPGSISWGFTSDMRYNMGGLGGRALDTTGNRIYMGGGGGAGDSNNGTGTGGGDGGGIVYILTGGTLSGTGSINANGATAANSISTTDGDGSGGGGGGGTVFIFSYSATISNITISANGGNGGSQVYGSAMNEAEGGGGGGAGGIIRTSNASSLARTVTGGLHGTSNATPMANFAPNGATKGSAGFITTGTISPYSGGSSLPIKLKYFAASAEDNVVKISWVTSAEINNDYFTIERSGDGENYSQITKINGSGNSTSNIEYHHVDDSPLQGTSFYRLIQTDYDGHSEVFSPVVIKVNSPVNLNTIISVQPNPFSSKFTVSCSTVKSGLIDFTLTDVSGRLVRKETSVTGVGLNTIPFENMADLPQGIYFLRMNSGAENYATVKILKRD
ncbi:MAG: T9SS type A sorting domain-containing protein [Bacteroidetes bacterium]|nr:T9SS type A sorting domain-containing protein [Bacteroidota bacterium]